MKSIEAIQEAYENGRNWPLRATEKEKIAYDYERLFDLTWTFKTFAELRNETNNRHLGKMTQVDIFKAIVVCSRQITRDLDVQTPENHFKRCWFPYSRIVEIVYAKGEELNGNIFLDATRMLFIGALIFRLPEGPWKEPIRDIVSNPNARQYKGTYPASTGDVAFSKTPSGNFEGPYTSASEILADLEDNLYSFLNKLEQH
jgi:hypothetical protein